MARTRRGVPLPKGAPRNARASIFAEIAGRSKSFRPARETLKRVRAVPTIFPDVDRKAKVGGWPIDRVAVVHGPSTAGKTTFVHGLGLSFLRRGHIYCYVDAELTTPISWLETLFGAYADDDRFFASRPTSYERAVDDVRKVARGLQKAREDGKVDPDTTCLFVIDSIRKLVPEGILERIKKMGAEGDDGSVDGFSGAAGRMRAALNSAWLDELNPLMYETGCGIVLVGREGEDATASARDKQYGKDWRLTGGKGLFFDSSFVVRVEHDSWMIVEEGGRKYIAGEKHRAVIRKTKVAGDLHETANFWTSNGRTHPEGFLRARDVLHVGEATGVLKRAGSWVSFSGRRWRSEANFLATAGTDVLDAIEVLARERFEADASVRADVVGGK
jgi:RecA/RadA recombinase